MQKVRANLRSAMVLDSLSTYAIFAMSRTGHIETWNNGARCTFGYEDVEVIGSHFSLIFTEVDIASGIPDAELLEATTLGTSTIDCWHKRQDGTLFYSSDTINARYDKSGALCGFTKVVQDVTERYETLRRLREDEAQLRLLVEAVTESAIFAFTASGQITFWNRGAENLFGYREAEVVGRHVSMLYPTDSVNRGDLDQELHQARVFGSALTEQMFSLEPRPPTRRDH